MITLASMMKGSAGQFEVVEDRHEVGTCQYYTDQWVSSWIMWLKGVLFGIAITLVWVFIIWCCCRVGFVSIGGCRSEQMPAKKIEITPKDDVIAAPVVPVKKKNRWVRDVMTMSQTTYVKAKRHNPVHDYNGDVFAGQAYAI